MAPWTTLVHSLALLPWSAIAIGLGVLAFIFIALGVWGICLQGLEVLAEVVNALYASANVLIFLWALSFAIYHIGFWAGISHGLVFAVLCTVLLGFALRWWCTVCLFSGAIATELIRVVWKKIDAQHSHPRGL
jgi:hypothetical protein